MSRLIRDCHSRNRLRKSKTRKPDFDPSTNSLWHRLEAFEFSGPYTDLTFGDQVARDNGWTLDDIRCVIDEYKRFCYLALRAGHEVMPSDQVWHLHLSYSRNY